MKLIKIKEEDALKYFNAFYNNSVFTFEGIDLNDTNGLSKLEETLKSAGYGKEEVKGYTYTGKMMNTVFALTNQNAYPDDLNFLSIPNFYHPMLKMAIGARWFDDIVSNNRIRQNAINGNIEEDYGGDIIFDGVEEVTFDDEATLL